MDKPETDSGGCLCGAVRYTIRSKPFAADYCHCRRCQRVTGAPVSAWMDFKAPQVEWLDNSTLAEYESTSDIRRGFCSKCGSTLTFRSVSHPQYLSLAITSLDNPEKYHPDYHIYTSAQMPWHIIEDEYPRYTEGKT